jgi:hypothetical protein
VGFNTKQRSEPPDDVAEVLAWVARNSAPLPTLAEAATARRMLSRATGRLDGKKAAASTARRHRIILANAMDYAVELGLLETNPIGVLKWTAPKVSSQVDRRSVVNPRFFLRLTSSAAAWRPQPDLPEGHRLLWSQIHGLGANVVVSGLEGGPRDDVDSDAKELLKILEQADVIKKRGAWPKLHK